MSDSETNAPKSDHELDELAFLQKQANSLISYALAKGWITEAKANTLFGDVSAATIDTIWSVSRDAADEVYRFRKEYERRYSYDQ